MPSQASATLGPPVPPVPPLQRGSNHGNPPRQPSPPNHQIRVIDQLCPAPKGYQGPLSKATVQHHTITLPLLSVFGCPFASNAPTHPTSRPSKSYRLLFNRGYLVILTFAIRLEYHLKTGVHPTYSTRMCTASVERGCSPYLA